MLPIEMHWQVRARDGVRRRSSTRGRDLLKRILRGVRRRSTTRGCDSLERILRNSFCH